ncbi:cytochrome ubiquinol oxidase subunit I [methanotrophic endosymbiont of Bathymodiolus puteoserpentis (Logatchev)]|jgi:cytochrome d ubiquinol oxidase subunit I|uniref:cytochrome ubiquinol oxidase subunit I n=1 Tax=methanotrophic endosymbiont of Bathymodiolus puteoserpentis (Logatchev) TaxID=343235 RepID=UPI00157B2591|nr:cytochrome ubiquinol oxidase subunit I [methanotrophic endosymbiont of Bathymodiolus puteoserpentis (Logatchev)]
MDTTIILLDRAHFAFNIIFHYLFPQLTMGLAALILLFKSMALWKHDEAYNRAARFWIKIFAINFVFGVVTGIPMEFLFGTNWAEFSRRTGGVIGSLLAMEGLFAFLMESAFLGLLLFAEQRLGPRGHWFAAFMVCFGTWLSGFFILATNAWMQHPVAYTVSSDGVYSLNSLWGLLTNPWLFWQYLHNMNATLITASFVVTAVGAYYLLAGKHLESARLFIRNGVMVATIATILQIFPFGHGEARQVFLHQPIKAAAMEGIFQTQKGAPLIILGQPNMHTETLDNPLVIPYLDSLMMTGKLDGELQGLDDFPKEDWPDAVPLVFYSFHAMVILGMLFASIMLLSAWLLWRKQLFESRWMLWVLMLSAPLPYFATIAGWMTTEIGRQPWLVYGLMRTVEGASPHVSSGNVLFTLLGFVLLYMLMGLLFLMLVLRLINIGPATIENNS